MPTNDDRGKLVVEFVSYVDPQAVDMERQEVLAAPVDRIDRDADIVAGQCRAEPLIDQAADAPGGVEIIGRAWRQELRIFNAGDEPGRHDEILADADAVLEHGIALVDAARDRDLGAGVGLGVCLLIGNAFTVDDAPQHLSIGMDRR